MAYNCSTRAPRPEVHGHRGCRGLFPENTLPAFLHAVALGVDVLELDVVISQDNRVVVAHEPWLAARLGYGPAGQLLDPATEQQHRLYDLPYATIRQCAVGVWPHPLFPDQQVAPSCRPLLHEVIQATTAACRQLSRPLVRYSVEIKSTSAGDGFFHPVPARFAELVMADLVREEAADRSTVLSFDYRALQAVRQLRPQQSVCLLVEEPLSVARAFEQLGFVPNVFGPAHWLVTPALLQQLRMQYPGVRLVPWTVNTLADLERVLTWPVAGITTDYPDRLLGLLGQT